jgi:hypothetical protein
VGWVRKIIRFSQKHSPNCDFYGRSTLLVITQPGGWVITQPGAASSPDGRRAEAHRRGSGGPLLCGRCAEASSGPHSRWEQGGTEKGVEKALEFSWLRRHLAPSASFPTGVWPAVLPPSSCGVLCLSDRFWVGSSGGISGGGARRSGGFVVE